MGTGVHAAVRPQRQNAVYLSDILSKLVTGPLMDVAGIEKKSVNFY